MLDMQQSLCEQFSKLNLNVHFKTTMKSYDTEGERATIVSHLIESCCCKEAAPVDGGNEV